MASTHLRIVSSVGCSTPKQNSTLHLRPHGAADEELEWFFSVEGVELEQRSNFMDSLVPVQHRADAEPSDEAGVYRVIFGHLGEVGDPDAGVLEAAYAPREWPKSLQSELRRLTGIVVRLAVAEIGMPETVAETEVLEHRLAARLADALKRLGPKGVERFRGKAQAHFDRAYSAYQHERGKGPSLVRAFR